ncbi:hypothetical protein [Deinococcus roseus]|uniref:Zinc ribbon domain-containing protein n=1 Tax=Deinococcus roseus TaxID=392414 RepID=A0ABQ2DJB3_9DEIO|nr:hypothetical protein [Deinococcus roseus]GGJ59969.1 hypothetical protein GCM10008938_52610 [Deinococcus roseus]
MAELQCPRCKSEQVTRRRIIHDGGVSAGVSFTGGVTTSGEAVGATTHTYSSTTLAKRHRPPEEPAVGFAFATAALTCVFSLIFLIALISVANNPDPDFKIGKIFLTVVFIFFAIASVYNVIDMLKKSEYKNSGEYERLSKEYDSQFVCLRCEEIFIPDFSKLS